MWSSFLSLNLLNAAIGLYGAKPLSILRCTWVTLPHINMTSSFRCTWTLIQSKIHIPNHSYWAIQRKFQHQIIYPHRKQRIIVIAQITHACWHASIFVLYNFIQFRNAIVGKFQQQLSCIGWNYAQQLSVPCWSSVSISILNSL